jgi:tetratricopeptide (TPR) repeat protein
MPVVPQEVREQLLDGAVAVLGQLDDYDEESAFAQVFDRLNQWSHASVIAGATSAATWRVDPLFAALPARLQAGTTPESLGSAVFDAATDVTSLRDQRWLADVAASARGDAVEDLDIAVNLFRWTVRSLALVSDPPMTATEAAPGSRWFLPGEILLSGRASSAQRAWIFLELLRHAGLDGVMLATGDPARGGVRPWIPALLSKGEIWLFEPTYGVPIPGPDGTGVATARQAAADPAILKRLSVADRSYPVQSADIAGLSVLVAADPWNLSRRMRAVEEQLVGARSMELALDADAVAQRGLEWLGAGEPAAGKQDQAGRAGLWEFPWEVLARRQSDAARVQAAVARDLAVMAVQVAQATGGDAVGGRRAARVVRPLYAARIREFRGDLDGPQGAKASYLAARPGRQAIADLLKTVPPEQADGVKRLFEQMKEDATYWLGILTLAEGQNATAVDYLGRMTLEAAPDSRWTDAARVNLAQALAALGRTDEAVKLLREDASPQRFGSRLLAEELEKKPQR